LGRGLVDPRPVDSRYVLDRERHIRRYPLPPRMPAVTVWLSMSDLRALEDEGTKREMTRSALLTERLHHKCPTPQKTPPKPCDRDHIEDSKPWVYERHLKLKGGGWSSELFDPEKRSWSLRPK
jgi:hypothetical protein